PRGSCGWPGAAGPAAGAAGATTGGSEPPAAPWPGAGWRWGQRSQRDLCPAGGTARHGTGPSAPGGSREGTAEWLEQAGRHLWNSANSLLECQDCQTVLGGVRRGDWHTWQGIIRGIDANHGMAPQHQPLLGTELLKASAPARVVNVSSFRHSVGTADSGYLTGQRRPGGHDAAYNSTKLMNVLFTAELARRLQGTGVTANALSPGVVGTSIMRHFSRGAGPSPEQGAASTIFCAISEEAEGISGKYFDSSCRLALPSELARDAALARKLWEASERLTGLSERG
uniref:Uncharacterized protein n=1 Tax=Junco hyemalis TaxID=40217 RepID=A0A8C5IRV8_JUNHY